MTLIAEAPRELTRDGRVDRIDEAAAAASQTRDAGVVVWRECHE